MKWRVWHVLFVVSLLTAAPVQAAFFGPAPDTEGPPNWKMRALVDVLLRIGGTVTIIVFVGMMAVLIRNDRRRTRRLSEMLRERRDD